MNQATKEGKICSSHVALRGDSRFALKFPKDSEVDIRESLSVEQLVNCEY